MFPITIYGIRVSFFVGYISIGTLDQLGWELPQKAQLLTPPFPNYRL